VTTPPPALDCAHAIEYAVVDDSVHFEQRHWLNVGGEWLGAAPRLAICRNLDETQFMIFHCDNDWNVLGVAAGYDTIAEAKSRAERSYHGLSAKWIPTGHSHEEAVKYVKERFEGFECSFCGRLPLQYQSVVGDEVRICNHCIDEFYQAIHRETDEI